MTVLSKSSSSELPCTQFITINIFMSQWDHYTRAVIWHQHKASLCQCPYLRKASQARHMPYCIHWQPYPCEMHCKQSSRHALSWKLCSEQHTQSEGTHLWDYLTPAQSHVVGWMWRIQLVLLSWSCTAWMYNLCIQEHTDVLIIFWMSVQWNL